MLLLILSAAAPAHAVSFSWKKFFSRFNQINPCEEVLDPELANLSQDISDPFPEILELRNLIYFDKFRPGPLESGAFYASNEFDWFRGILDLTETDVVIGFGTNSAWDIAVRKNAKVLVLGDWDKTVLQGQELFFRPLILASESPAEFLCYLNGVQPPVNAAGLSLEDAFVYIEQHKAEVFKVSDLIKKLDAIPTLTQAHKDFITSYFEALFNRASLVDPHAFGSFLGYGAYQKAIFSEYFSKRYRPSRLIEQGASAVEVNNPYFSFLSSAEGYLRLKSVFLNNLYYVKSPYNNPNLYLAVKKLAEEKNLSRFSVSTSNIIDVSSSGSQSVAQKRELQFISTISETLNPKLENPVAFFQTKGATSPHEYEKFNITSEILKTADADFFKYQFYLRTKKLKFSPKGPYYCHFYFSRHLSVFLIRQPSKAFAEVHSFSDVLLKTDLDFRSEEEKKSFTLMVLKAINQERKFNSDLNKTLGNLFPMGLENYILKLSAQE